MRTVLRDAPLPFPKEPRQKINSRLPHLKRIILNPRMHLVFLEDIEQRHTYIARHRVAGFP